MNVPIRCPPRELHAETTLGKCSETASLARSHCSLGSSRSLLSNRCVCVYIYIYIYIHTYTYTYIYIYIYIYI